MVLLANFGYDVIQWCKGETMGIIISIEIPEHIMLGRIIRTKNQNVLN